MYDNMHQFISCEYPNTPVYDVTNIASTGLTLIGNQEKWYLKEERLIVKAPYLASGCYWTDYLVECLASSLGSQLGFDVVKQHLCWIVDDNRRFLGTASESYLEEGMEYQTFYRNLNYSKDRPIFLKDPFEFILNKYLEIFQGHPETREVSPSVIKRYLLGMVCLDVLLGNDDRHLNNFGIGIHQPSGKPFLPPLFDFGLGLYQGSPDYLMMDSDRAYSSIRLRPWELHPSSAYLKASEVFDCTLFPNGAPCIDLTGLIMPSFMAERYIRLMASKMEIIVKGRPVLPKFADSWHGVTSLPIDSLENVKHYPPTMDRYLQHDNYKVTLMWRGSKIFTISSKNAEVRVDWKATTEFCYPPEIFEAFADAQDIKTILETRQRRHPFAEVMDARDSAFSKCLSATGEYNLTPAEAAALKESREIYCATVGLGNFLKQRLPSLSRHNLQRILDDMGDPYAQPLREVLLAASHGISIDDEFWILVNGEDLTYNDVRIR